MTFSLPRVFIVLTALFAACGGSLAKQGQHGAVDTPIDTPPQSDLTVGEPAGDGPPFTIDARDARDAPGTGSCQLEITQDGTCNALALQGTTITSTCSTAAAPVASGGTIEDGTYVLETSTYYGSCPVAMSQQRITWVICGSSWETVQEVQRIAGNPDGGLIIERVGFSPVTLDAASIQARIGCWNAPGTAQPGVIWGYDATPGHLALYISTSPGVHVDSFRKQ